MLYNILYYIFYILSIGGILVVSLLVYSKRKEVQYKYFAIFALLLDLWLGVQFCAQILSGGELMSTLALRLSVAISPFFILYFFNFAVAYVEMNISRRGLHFILPSIFAVVTIFTDWVVKSGDATLHGIALSEGPLYYIVVGYVVVYIVIAISYILREMRKKTIRSAAKKQANKILIIGSLPAALFSFIASTVFAKEPLSQLLIPFALFFMIATFSYAIIRHRLFDIRLVAVRALAYSFSLATLAALYSLMAFGLANVLLGTHDNLPQQLFYLVIALLLALTFAPLKNFFDKVTRSIFYQDAYESQKVIDGLSSALVSTVDIKSLSEHTAEILRNALKSQYIAIVLPSEENANDKKERRIIIHGHDGSLEGNKLYSLLSRHKGKVVVQDEVITDKGNLFKVMQESGCAVAARLETHNELMGYVLFGVKNSGRPYTSQDIELIHTTTDELALGIQNALRFEEIRSFNRTLQGRIEDATAQLRKKNAELRKLDATKDEFVSMASHQLRTPLTSVKGYISMVLEGDAGKLTKMQRQLLGEAFTSSERMVHLISDFLNVSRLQTGKFLIEARQIDLSKVVAQEVESLQTTAKAHNMKLLYRMPSHFPLLYVDEGKIRQVIMNFIDNAIYYSKEHTTITVKVYLEGPDAVVTVHDTGIGVPKAEQAHLFTKFFRASNARKQRPDGTGVGLFLAKKVVTAHGGSMIFESRQGEGSTFGFRLPVKRLSNAPANDAEKLDK